MLLAMLLVGGLGLAFDDSEVRERTVEVVFDNVPLAQSSERAGTEDAVRSGLDNTGGPGPINIPAAARRLVLFTLALAATRNAEELLDDEGGGWLASIVLDALGDTMPFVFTVAVILFLCRVLPWPRMREIWPGAVVAAALIQRRRAPLRALDATA